MTDTITVKDHGGQEVRIPMPYDAREMMRQLWWHHLGIDPLSLPENSRQTIDRNITTAMNRAFDPPPSF
jgi:hypothetical protein